MRWRSRALGNLCKLQLLGITGQISLLQPTWNNWAGRKRLRAIKSKAWHTVHSLSLSLFTGVHYKLLQMCSNAWHQSTSYWTLRLFRMLSVHCPVVSTNLSAQCPSHKNREKNLITAEKRCQLYNCFCKLVGVASGNDCRSSDFPTMQQDFQTTNLIIDDYF